MDFVYISKPEPDLQAQLTFSLHCGSASYVSAGHVSFNRNYIYCGGSWKKKAQK